MIINAAGIFRLQYFFFHDFFFRISINMVKIMIGAASCQGVEKKVENASGKSSRRSDNWGRIMYGEEYHGPVKSSS